MCALKRNYAVGNMPPCDTDRAASGRAYAARRADDSRSKQRVHA